MVGTCLRPIDVIGKISRMKVLVVLINNAGIFLNL